MPSAPCTTTWRQSCAHHKFRPPAGTRPHTFPAISHLSPTIPASLCFILYLPQSIISYPSLTTSSNYMARTSSTSSQPPTFSGLQSSTPRPRPQPRTYRQPNPPSRRQSLHTVPLTAKLHIHWLFRSNIPRRRSMPLPTDVNKRNFFGIGEIIGVLANVRAFTLCRAGADVLAM